MKVKELIELLKKVDADKDVYVVCNNHYSTDIVVENMIYNVYLMENVENES
jgi:hypothetical protein